MSRLPLVVLALGAAAALLLVATYQLRERLVAESSAVIRAAGEIRRDVAVSHLWLEERLSGDVVDRKELWGRLDHARSLAGGLAAAARMDPPLRAQAEEVRGFLDQLRSVARQRLEGMRHGEGLADVGIGSPLDERYDQLFRELDASAAVLERMSEERLATASSRARVAFLVLWIGWLAVVGVAAWGLHSRERRRRAAEEALRQSEAQLLQAQKLEAVGRLAGGLAHDINNYIAAITSQCELVKMQVAPEDRIAGKMDMVLSTAGKVTALIRRLLAFSRQQPVQPEVVDLDEIIEGLRPMLSSLAGDAIRLEVLPGEGLWRVEVDPAQVEQVVINLLINAREASPEEGTVTLETANCRLGAEVVRENPTARPGDYVMIAVSDRGAGIPAEIRDRIFEPFFTTKAGGARGLGLATVYGIARQNGGHVTVYSEAGRGTTFKVYLPRTLEPGSAAAPAAGDSAVARGAGETILLIDDNDELRSSTRAVLEAMGYRVIAAAGGEEALAAVEEMEQEDGRFDLVISDVVMPGLSGREVVARLRERDPGLRVLFISGYTDNAVLRHGLLDGDFDFLEKPFSLSGLATRVREILERRPADKKRGTGVVTRP